MKRLLPLLLLSSLALLAGCDTGGVVCDAPKSACDGKTCLDLTSDPLNCGGCGIACGTGQICEAGACGCLPGSVMCDGTCVRNDSDPKNCGACGTVCAGEFTKCQAGACAVSCGGATPDECAGACVNLKKDQTHCGACGTACGQGTSCVEGSCQSTVYAACFNTGELVALDDNGVRAPGSVATGSGPQSLAQFGKELLLADGVDNALYSFERKSPPVRRGHLDKLGKAVNQVVVRDGRAYAVNSVDNTVQIIDLAKAPATSTEPDSGRTVAEIPTAVGEPASALNTSPSFAAFAGDNLFVTLLGSCFAPEGELAGNRLLELDVSGAGKTLRGLQFKAADYRKDPEQTFNSPRPAGLAAVGSRLFVAIGNLKAGCYGAAGPGYLAVVETSGAQLELVKNVELPAQCRNPGFVLAHAGKVYVSCAGEYGYAATVQESVVVLDAASGDVLRTTTFPRCDGTEPFDGLGACRTAVPGRLSLRGDRLFIADNNAGRLFMTDLDGTPVAGRENGVAICPLKCDASNANCFQFTADVLAAQ